MTKHFLNLWKRHLTLPYMFHHWNIQHYGACFLFLLLSVCECIFILSQKQVRSSVSKIIPISAFDNLVVEGSAILVSVVSVSMFTESEFLHGDTYFPTEVTLLCLHTHFWIFRGSMWFSFDWINQGCSQNIQCMFVSFALFLHLCLVALFCTEF